MCFVQPLTNDSTKLPAGKRRRLLQLQHRGLGWQLDFILPNARSLLSAPSCAQVKALQAKSVLLNTSSAPTCCLQRHTKLPNSDFFLYNYSYLQPACELPSEPFMMSHRPRSLSQVRLMRGATPSCWFWPKGPSEELIERRSEHPV